MTNPSDDKVVQLHWSKDIQDLPAKDVLDFARIFIDHAERFVKTLHRKNVSVSLVGVKRGSAAVRLTVRAPTGEEEAVVVKLIDEQLGRDPAFRSSVAAIARGRGTVKFGVGKSVKGLRLLEPPPAAVPGPVDARSGFDTLVGELTRIGGEDAALGQLRIDLPESALVEVVFSSKEHAKQYTAMLYTLVEVTGICTYRGYVPRKVTDIISLLKVPTRSDVALVKDVDDWMSKLVWEGPADEEEG
jgi:hypothetical protein